ncbi:UDP-3-O-acylglucosamine N-acyltransferase-like [Sitodiplosis mosellana]|uniref:UDP-3-O-acylglucosamine N-acyltransferase-like n=1 Tax=Sitodiplosis mosellana TaxID=263140 RepID=UPI002444D89B|nr:UDP-3-O-acylglucosamine N-acyltransferase-like [Sitodiplosis mosellana]
MFKFTLFLFSVNVAINSLFVGAAIDSTARLGQNTTIDSSADIKANVEVGNSVSVGRSSSIGERSKLGQNVNIGQNCTIGSDAIISNFTVIGSGTTIGNGCTLSEFTSIGSRVKIGNGVKVSKYVSVANGVEIKDNSIVDDFCAIRSNIPSNVYIGKFASVQANSIVNDLAIVHKYVNIASNTTVQNNAVIMRAPTTNELFEKSAPIANISDTQIQGASDKSAVLSTTFNTMFDGLLDAQINDLKSKCVQGGNTIFKPDLAAIKTLYLIRSGIESSLSSQAGTNPQPGTNTPQQSVTIESKDGNIFVGVGFR